MVEDLRDMLWGLLGWGEDAPPEAAPEASVGAPKALHFGPRHKRQALILFYSRLLQDHFQECDLEVAAADLSDIQRDVEEHFARGFPCRAQLDEEADAEDETRALAYEGRGEKLPVQRLLPRGWRDPRSACPSSRGSLDRGRAGSARGSRFSRPLASKTNSVSRRSSERGPPRELLGDGSEDDGAEVQKISTESLRQLLPRRRRRVEDSASEQSRAVDTARAGQEPLGH
mmetsp:Transcript_76243/g.210915  ORF Transcript_76243/g.210915 Transcript_76243/m.210915 type:complete len:229 (+) Transcript_76243:2-688(+)